MPKYVPVILATVIFAVVAPIINKALGIDLSEFGVSDFGRLVHVAMYMLAGAGLYAINRRYSSSPF